MPCLPRRSLKHCCSTTDRGETPIPDLPVGFSHKCHAALHVTKTVQSQHLTFASQLCKHDASYWANMCRVCRNVANTPNIGKVYRNFANTFEAQGKMTKCIVGDPHVEFFYPKFARVESGILSAKGPTGLELFYTFFRT